MQLIAKHTSMHNEPNFHHHPDQQQTASPTRAAVSKKYCSAVVEPRHPMYWARQWEHPYLLGETSSPLDSGSFPDLVEGR